MIHKVGIHRINFYLSVIFLVTSGSPGTEEIVLLDSDLQKGEIFLSNHVIFIYLCMLTMK